MHVLDAADYKKAIAIPHSRFVHTLFNDIDVQHKMCSLFTY